MNLKDINIFGVRHLSPRTAYHLLNDLKEKNPRIILIEGPVDCNFLIDSIAGDKVKPPFAILSYTEEEPIRSIMYPFGAYSPEYVAIKYAKENNIEVRFIDMPSSYFFLEKEIVEDDIPKIDIHEEIAKRSGYEDYESFWESYFEHNRDKEDFISALKELGKSLRELDKPSLENDFRENHMIREILKAKKEGYDYDEIYVVCGAFHVQGILNESGKVNLLKGIKAPKVSHTLMPYSNFKLSSYSGYGAGNKAPAYFNQMFNSMMEEKEEEFPSIYMATLARMVRSLGGNASPASVIEGVSLSNTLALLKGRENANLRDLKDAAIATIGYGEVEGLVDAMAKIEIGNVYGSVLDNENLTPIQMDFNKRVKEFRLSKYLNGEKVEIKLDLREETGKAKSYFLHKLEILNIGFCNQIRDNQERGSFREIWALHYTPNCEINLVELIIKGTTINEAVITTLKNEVENNKSIDNVLAVLRKSLLCGESSIVDMCRIFIEELSVHELDFIKLAKTCETLAFVINFGDVRCINKEDYYPLLNKIFFKSKNTIVNQCNVNEEKSLEVVFHIEELNRMSKDFSEIVDREGFKDSLDTVYENRNNSPIIIGYLLNILLREDRASEEELRKEISAYFSYGVDMEKSTLWLQGLCYKNVAILCNKDYLWVTLAQYIKTLEDDEFKRILVALRKALISFSSNEKIKMGEILSTHWGLKGIKTSIDMVNTYVDMKEFDLSIFDLLDEYDFGEF